MSTAPRRILIVVLVIALAWALGSYGFNRYRKKEAEPRPRLAIDGVDLAEATAIARACTLARDLGNPPANDMGPRQFEEAAREVALEYGASIEVVAGDDLIGAGYPAVHAVGRAADPVFPDSNSDRLRWRVTLRPQMAESPKIGEDERHWSSPTRAAPTESPMRRRRPWVWVLAAALVGWQLGSRSAVPHRTHAGVR